jgi:mannose-P-dolichol utilization defect protein 1
MLLLLLQLVADTLCHSQQHNPTPLTYKYYIFSNECYDTFFLHKDLLNINCIKTVNLTLTQSIAKLLGYLVVIGAAIVKLPQIMKIIKKRSIYGVSFPSVLFEVPQY